MDLPDDTKELLKSHFGIDISLNLLSISDSSSSESDSKSISHDVNHLQYYRDRFPERYSSFEAEQPRVCSPIALISYEDEYVRKLIIAIFEKKLVDGWTFFCDGKKNLPARYHYHFGDYEQIDWFGEDFKNGRIVCSCYYNRKALIRKSRIAVILAKFEKKRNILISPPTVAISFSSFPTTNEIVAQLRSKGVPENEDTRYIIKPSMTNQANGISLAKGLQQVVQKVSESDEIALVGGLVIQHYIEPWLIAGRKFHLRVFVLLVGNVKAYVYQPMLSIFSLHNYTRHKDDLEFTKAHLTNISHQNIHDSQAQSDCMRLLDEEFTINEIMTSYNMSLDTVKDIVCRLKEQVNRISASVVEAATSEIDFLLRENCFEIFGFDFVVDEDRNVLFLEANAEPDLSKAGERLQPIIDQMLKDVIYLTVDCNSKFSKGEPSSGLQISERMKLVYSKEV